MAAKKDETEKERRAREAREKAAKLRLHKPLASSSKMQGSDAGDMPELKHTSPFGGWREKTATVPHLREGTSSVPKGKRTRTKIRKRHELPPDVIAGPTRADVKEATRTEGVRMGEFDLDRVESGGKDKPSFAVMVDSNGKEHNIELDQGQKRPSKAQLRELKERLARKKEYGAKGEAFRQRALKRKRRHTEETGTSSMKLR